MSGFTVAAILGLLLGFLSGVGCRGREVHDFPQRYRAALRDAIAGGTGQQYREQMRKLQRQ